MPIRALLNGKDIIAPLDEKEWESLQRRVRTKQIELHLPCCQGLSYPRVSPRGAQHFVHFTNSGCTPESELHLLAKLEIIKACRQLGYEAIPEFRGNGWRADVLVRSPKWECCFEVQLSPQSFQETIRRQEVYISHNLRCCWLFSSIPQRQALTLEQQPLVSQYETPMFRLNEKSRGRDYQFEVEVNSAKRPLSQFVGDLLRKKLRYSQSNVIGGIKAAVQLWRTSCPHCGYIMHFFNVEDLQAQTQCGAKLAFGLNDFTLLYPKAYTGFLEFYLTGIPPEIREYLRIESRGEEPFWEFVCSGCGQTRLSEKPPSSTRHKRLTSLVFSTESNMAPEIALNHWCESPLCEPASPVSGNEIHDVLSRRDLPWKCTAIRQFERKIDFKQRLPYRHYVSYAKQA